MKKNMLRGLGVFVILGILFLLAWQTGAPEHFVSPATPSAEDGANTPPVFDPTSVSTVITEASTGKEYISNQLIVEFSAEVSEADSLAIIAEVQGVMLQRFTKAPLFLIRVTDPGDGSGVRRILEELHADPRVKNITLNYLAQTIDEGSVE